VTPPANPPQWVSDELARREAEARKAYAGFPDCLKALCSECEYVRRTLKRMSEYHPLTWATSDTDTPIEDAPYQEASEQ